MILGHSKQWKFLERSMERGKIPHALLFIGEKGFGKKTLALEFIKLLNCQNDTRHSLCDLPCQICENCRQIEKRIYPDLIFISPNEKKEIGVAEVRALRSRLALRSFNRSFKAIVIDGIDSSTQEAQNSFLKILEEPGGQTLFILIAQYVESLLPTILSRVETLKFYPLPEKEIKEFLKKEKGLAENKAQEIASLSRGKPGLAINFVSQPDYFEKYQKRIKEAEGIINSDYIKRFKYAKEICQQEEEKEVLNIWLYHFHSRLISAFNKQKDSKYSLSQLAKILTVIQETQFLLSSTNINSKLAFERLMLEL